MASVSQLTCKPIEKCTIKTPYGEIHGKKCIQGTELNRLVSLEDFKGISQRGQILPSKTTEHVSLSSCPTQTYGGEVRLILDAAKVSQLETFKPMCYLPLRYFEESPHKKEVMAQVGEEVSQLSVQGKDDAHNYVRAKYGIGEAIFASECEFETYEPVPIKSTLKRVEFWIGEWEKRPGIQMSCDNFTPAMAGIYADPQDYVERIQEAKHIAKKLGVPFKVKSCFKKLCPGVRGFLPSTERAIELTEENLAKLGEGIIPESKLSTEIPEPECRC